MSFGSEYSCNRLSISLTRSMLRLFFLVACDLATISTLYRLSEFLVMPSCILPLCRYGFDYLYLQLVVLLYCYYVIDDNFVSSFMGNHWVYAWFLIVRFICVVDLSEGCDRLWSMDTWSSIGLAWIFKAE